MHFIKTPRQFVIVIVAAFAAPVVFFFLLAMFLTSGFHLDMDSAEMSPESVAKRLEPIGRVVVAEQGIAAKVEKTGEEVFKAVCAACHATGALDAPKIGDKKAWAEHIKEGLDHLVENAIKGVNQMPPKGGNPELSDAEVARAVVYLTNQSGANFKEPAAAAPPAKETALASAAAPSDKETTAPAPQLAQPPDQKAGAGADGKSVYEASCAACHASGLAGAPKTGDKPQWAPRTAQGIDALYASALKGKGAMPAKGGSPSLSDTQVNAAVDYLVKLAK